MSTRAWLAVTLVAASGFAWWEHARHQHAMAQLAPIETAAAVAVPTAAPTPAAGSMSLEQQGAGLSARMLAWYRASTDRELQARLNALDINLSHLRGGYLAGSADEVEGGRLLAELGQHVAARELSEDQARSLGERMEQAAVAMRGKLAAATDPALLPWTEAFRARHAAAPTEPCCAQQFQDAWHLLKARDFAALDALVRSIRDRRQRLSGGTLAIHRFYQLLGHPPNAPPPTGAVDWRLSALQSWVAAAPDSVAARVTLAQYHENLAWKLRGDAYADALTAEQSTAFDQQLELADHSLAPGDAARDPHAATLAMRLVHFAANPRDLLDQRFRQASALFPDDDASYGEYAILLQRKWYGRSGELAAWLDSLARVPAGERGELAYAQAMVELGTCCGLPDLLSANAIRWPVLRASLLLRESRYGLGEADAEVLLWAAARFLDRETAAHALGLVRGYDERIWGSHEDMAAAIAWTVGRGPD